MKAEINEVGVLWISEGASSKDACGENSQAEDHHRNDVVRAVGNPSQPAVQSGPADEPPNRSRNHDCSQGGHKVFHTVVVISIAVVGGGQGEEPSVGPEQAGCKPHGESGGGN